jgi:hypothetical protein
MSDPTTPTTKRQSARNAHKSDKAAPPTKKQKSGKENDGNTNTKGMEKSDEIHGTNAASNDNTSNTNGDEDHGEVVVVRVHQGVDRREEQRRLEEEEGEEEEDDDGGEQVPTNDTGAEIQGERQGIQKSARDILMSGFMDFEHDENENSNGSLHRNEVRPNIQGQNRQVVEGAVTRELNKALSHRAAGHCREKHMTDRVVDYCKTQLFRKVKFITGEEMTTLALTTVMDALNIVAPERPNFVKLYTTCVTGSINTKRSTCEQAGAKIVRDLLIQKQHETENRGPPYRMDSLVKLRRSYDGSAEDLEAFVWFLGTFLDCVSGARAWGGQRKYVEEVSKAEIKGVGGKIKLVTVSDEAFGLLLYENYVDKWIQKYHDERRTLLPSMLSTAEKKKRGATKMRGKYTTGSVGNCEFGGWSERGMRRFNELCDTVEEDRNDPKAQIMEGYLLKEIRRKKYGETAPAIESDDDSVNDLLNGAPAVRAYCEL